MEHACRLALKKAGLCAQDMRYLYGGDLLGQLIATTFGIKNMDIPFFGIYGACSTAGEGLSLGSMAIAGGFADALLVTASSHFGGAEKTFRFPLEYANQRPLSSTWTVTGSGAFVLSSTTGDIVIRGITTGKIVDYGVKDSLNMGACMAPAAASTIYQHFQDFSATPGDYDRIFTGDLGKIGQEILFKLLIENGLDISEKHRDCGIEIFNPDTQNTGSGGSGCGCSAITLAAYIIPRMLDGTWNRVLFVPTGALLSTVSFNEGQPIPGIAHAILLERRELRKNESKEG
jgi:stage V sporulation protein AD